MKKILALTAVAALFAGCDFIGSDAPSVAFASLTVNDLAVGPDVAPVVEIQDIAGRTYFSADVTSGAALGSFELAAVQGDYFVVLIDRDAPGVYQFVGVSSAFRAGDLTGDTSLEIRSQGGATLGTAVLDVE